MNGNPTLKEIQIGGQAVIEGVVMRGPHRWALAVRRPDGGITVMVNPSDTLADRFPRLNRPPFRGVITLLDSLIIGFRSIALSAEISLDREEGPPAVGEGDSRALGPAHLAVTMVLALVVFLGLFIALPAVVARPLDRYVNSTVMYNLMEGGIRIAIFLAYLAAISLLPDIRRVFQYHGAEHKVVHAYEAGEPLTPASAARFSTAHMRCGTTFILVILVVSVLLFSLTGRPALWLRVVERLALIPLVAAVSYEIIRFASRHEKLPAVRAVMTPGLILQKITTREPDREQLEVAIDALNAALEG